MNVKSRAMCDEKDRPVWSASLPERLIGELLRPGEEVLAGLDPRVQAKLGLPGDGGTEV